MNGARVKWLVTGRDVPDPAYDLLSAPLTAFVIALLAAAVGLCGSLFSSEIKESTARLLRGPRGSLDVLVLLFWLISLTWAVLFYMRLIAESDEKKRLERAINRCPNPQVLRTYHASFAAVAAALDRAKALPETMEGLKQLGARLREALKELLNFCRNFSDPVQGTLRGCNVMLVRNGSFAQGCLDKLRFHPDGHTTSDLLAILEMPSALVVSSSETPHVVSIALPVPRELKGKHGTIRALPGAPNALLTGKLSVHRDTRQMLAECTDLDGEVREELRRYFSDDGDGRNVRSFASVRVGTADDPVAVLNFDYAEPDLLGPSEYYGTFLALLAPMLHLLREPLDRFARLELSLGDPG